MRLTKAQKQRVELLETKLDLARQMMTKLEIISSFGQRPVDLSISPVKLEIALISMSLQCGKRRCSECDAWERSNCLIAARGAYLSRHRSNRAAIDELSLTILGLLS